LREIFISVASETSATANGGPPKSPRDFALLRADRDSLASLHATSFALQDGLQDAPNSRAHINPVGISLNRNVGTEFGKLANNEPAFTISNAGVMRCAALTPD
jgi:hypothetical protein